VSICIREVYGTLAKEEQIMAFSTRFLAADAQLLHDSSTHGMAREVSFFDV
jgi:hypothetical protein